MSYNPVTDFLALLRQQGNAVAFERMPGLDYIVAALARAGMFTLFVGQTAPTANQQNTAWLKPSNPSWVAEGTLFLWNPITLQYEIATPALWASFLTVANSFQSVTGAAGTITVKTTLLAVQRTAPTATALQLPAVASRGGKALQIVDWSAAVVNHVLTLTAQGAETIMQNATFQLLSSADQLSGVTLYPSVDLNGWVIAP